MFMNSSKNRYSYKVGVTYDCYFGKTPYDCYFGKTPYLRTKQKTPFQSAVSYTFFNNKFMVSGPWGMLKRFVFRLSLELSLSPRFSAQGLEKWGQLSGYQFPGTRVRLVYYKEKSRPKELTFGPTCLKMSFFLRFFCQEKGDFVQFVSPSRIVKVTLMSQCLGNL